MYFIRIVLSIEIKPQSDIKYLTLLPKECREEEKQTTETKVCGTILKIMMNYLQGELKECIKATNLCAV